MDVEEWSGVSPLYPSVTGDKNRRKLARSGVLLLTLVLCLSVVTGCGERPMRPGESPLVPEAPLGEEIVVWDMRQPHFPGLRPYEEEVERVCDGFEEASGIRVSLAFVTRWELPAAVETAAREGKLPDVLFTGEFPCLTGLERDLTGFLDPHEFQDPSLRAWTVGGKTFGIPAAVFWLGVAVRKDARGPQTEGDDVAGVPPASGRNTGALGLFPSSEAFMHVAVFGLSGKERDAEEIATYLSWLKATLKPPSGPCLEEFRRGEIKGLYGVTPYMFKWLRITSQPGASDQPVLRPLAFDGGETGFAFTVPGYVVLSRSESKLKASAELARLLAQNYGRWMARAAGLVPARVDDLPVFTVESGLAKEERLAVLKALDSDATAHLWTHVHGPGQNGAPRALTARREIQERLAGVFSRWFSGNVDGEELVREITSAIKGNTTR